MNTARWTAIAAVAALAVGVGVLAAVAFDHANPDNPAEIANPVPTFTLGVQTPTPTPTTPPPPIAPPRETERFLSVGSEAMWRATAGLCGGTGPVVERSGDGGATWTDVTARYLGLAQVGSLDAFTASDAEMVAGVGAACDTQALRTYTDGEFWASYSDVLAASRYIDLADPALVHLGGGATTAAPCAEARGFRAAGATVALVCDGTAYVWRDDAWAPLSTGVTSAVAVAGSDVVVAHSADDCAGLAVTRFANADAASGTRLACVEGTDAAAPTALAMSGASVLVWSGDVWTSVG